MAKPRFEVIKRHILSNIEQGRWQPGSPVPSENQLAERFGVSRMTARRALSELTHGGVLARTRGAGTFVAEQLPTGSLLEIRNIADEIHERGHRHRAEVVAQATVTVDATITPLLAIPEGTCWFSQILHFENDVALQLEERYVNPDIAPDYLEQDFTHITPSAYLSHIAPLSEADHWIEAVNVDPARGALLGIAETDPCLKISRRTYSAGAPRSTPRVVSFAYLFHPGQRYRLGGHLDF